MEISRSRETGQAHANFAVEEKLARRMMLRNKGSSDGKKGQRGMKRARVGPRSVAMRESLNQGALWKQRAHPTPQNDPEGPQAIKE